MPGGGAFLPSIKPATTLPPPAVRIMMAPAPSIAGPGSAASSARADVLRRSARTRPSLRDHRRGAWGAREPAALLVGLGRQVDAGGLERGAHGIPRSKMYGRERARPDAALA